MSALGTIPLGYRGGFVGWAETSRHSANLRVSSATSEEQTQAPLAEGRSAAFTISPVLATGLFLAAVDLITATRLFGRLHAATEALPNTGSLTLLLVLAAALALLPLLHPASKLLVFAAPASSRRRAWLRAAVATLCVPASLCPVTVVSLLLITGH